MKKNIIIFFKCFDLYTIEILKEKMTSSVYDVDLFLPDLNTSNISNF